MSWSVNFAGKPEAIKRKLADQSAQLSGLSKDEFDTAKPALDTLLDQNVGNGVVLLNASGHASFDGAGKKTYSVCTVELRTLGQLAE